MKNISNKLTALGLPVFWQYFVCFHFAIIFTLFLVNDPFWTYFFSIILKLLTVAGVVAGYIINKQKAYPWIFLVTAVTTIALSVILKSLIHFGLDMSQDIPYWIEQFGIVTIVLFGINIIFFFEARSSLKGITLDFTLLSIACISLVFLISPDYLNTFINTQTVYQQMSLLHLVMSIGVIILLILNIALITTFQFKDAILIFVVLSVSFHFFIDSAITFNLIKNSQINQHLSLMLYHLAGSFAIITIFVEKLELNYVSHITNKTGTAFVWTANIAALIAIPAGVIYRYMQELPQVNALLLALTSLVITTMVIARFSTLIKQSNQQRKKLLNIALKDDLTGVYNYLGFQEKYALFVKKNPLLVIINIDDFKSINDLYGRQFGNSVLQSLAKRLKSQENVKLIARTNADTFMVLLKNSVENTEQQYRTLHKKLGIWDIIEKQRVAVPLTFGASFNKHKIEIDTLVKQAEHALYLARQKHSNHALFSADQASKALPRQELREILQQAIDCDYLPVHFQPIYDVEDGSLKAIELLIRLQSKEYGLLLPGQFLKQAQAYGLLNSLTRVCIRMIAKNIDRLPQVTINVNIPSFMLDDPILLGEFIRGFKELKLSTNRFCIEVMEDENIPAEHLVDAVTELKKEGFSIAMDDFGTGYSSLSRLSMIPFDTVKIDRSLLLAAAEGNKAILESAITLIKRLGIAVVVEGVETVEHLSLIRLLGANSVQGFLLSKPVDLEKTTRLPLNAANIIDAF